MLTPDIQLALQRAELFPLATASRSGTPNVVPVKYVRAAGPDRLWITDNYLGKTLANLRENPEAALYVWSTEPKLCVQIKGTVTIHIEGDDYESMKAQVRAGKPELPAKSLVVLRIREIFQCLPGAEPGKRLWPTPEAAAAESPAP